MKIIEENKSGKIQKDCILVNRTPVYTYIDVKNIRKRMSMTQKQFSEAFGVSVKTIEAWENGRNRPNGVAMRLLEICEKNPDLFVELNIINLK
ncbi:MULTISPECIES: helix-turn-helix domain-containing protein [unclassified Peribacillus]|uniref:helix-turn-helix domain-containing protein n=1 Tax=unclassified Peribacillus TaxID=2675266 RepID=UPI001F4D6C03|nr:MULTISPECIES: type II toxin-antitoxin system MqsA family antitoxin [unclassified Peribacillus]MCK1986051.1 type II toxin-antitoxin system MqsA family antitoxin [Peribacillus sp. Aquil_B1]MCK2011349.1 type II toxin-antitoxin system MqsA family antitoxin [Peribacillus sp. Aquil_B8]